MSDFAKILRSKRFGQLVVMADSGDEGEPALIVYAKPDTLGVSSSSISFPDTDKGWDALYKTLASISLDDAERLVSDMFELANHFGDYDDD